MTVNGDAAERAFIDEIQKILAKRPPAKPPE